MVVAIIVLIVLLVIGLGSYAAYRHSRASVGPGPGYGAVPPGPGPQPPNGPGFAPLNPGGKGSFVEQYRTKPGTPPPPPRGAANGTPTTMGTVFVNLTAICKLTGKQVAECTCDRCTKLRKKV